MLSAALDEYLGYRAASDWAPAALRSRRYMLRRFVAHLEACGHLRWATVDGEDCTAFILALEEQGLARSSRDAFAWAVRGFGQWLLAQGLTLRDPTTDLSVLDDDGFPLPPAPLTEAQVAALFAALPRASVVDLRNRLHLELLYSCALRNAEAVSLDVGDVDLDGRALFVRIAKGGTPRALPLMPGTLVAAGEYLALRRELLRGPDHGALLLTTTGRRLQPWYLQRWLASASRSLGYRVHPHLLRHSIAVHLLRQGADVRHIQRFLGHASLETTKVYLRLVPGHLRDDYDKAMPPMPVGP
jgi:site-specific recombinase XerD